jgi:hypothetical protein
MPIPNLKNKTAEVAFNLFDYFTPVVRKQDIPCTENWVGHTTTQKNVIAIPSVTRPSGMTKKWARHNPNFQSFCACQFPKLKF